VTWLRATTPHVTEKKFLVLDENDAHGRATVVVVVDGSKNPKI